ncbi:hypothetical protein [Nostoc sp.]|uniref:hypothetical protein n=1 Tax=Nostoc sp. TaxID=1180 RepID=UPI002FFC3626
MITKKTQLIIAASVISLVIVLNGLNQPRNKNPEDSISKPETVKPFSPREYANSVKAKLKTIEGQQYFTDFSDDSFVSLKETQCDLINKYGNKYTAKDVFAHKFKTELSHRSIFVDDAFAKDIAEALVYTADEYGCEEDLD